MSSSYYCIDRNELLKYAKFGSFSYLSCAKREMHTFQTSIEVYMHGSNYKCICALKWNLESVGIIV